MSAAERHEVVVIGAGLSGLHAAMQLQSQGIDVVVLEAQSRIGGRIHSMRQLGANTEAGGTYIGAGYERIFGVTERLGINLIDVTPVLEFFREQDLVLGNEIISQDAWADHPANVFPDKDKALLPWNFHRVVSMRDNPLGCAADWLDPAFAHYDVSVHEWMRSLGIDDAAIALGYGINSSFGADAHDVSALMLFFRGAFSKDQRKKAPGDSLGFTVENGVQRIPEAMAAALESEVRLGYEVEAIEASGSGLRLVCSNGREFEAGSVVCSLPWGALARVHIDPPLTGAQAQAVAEIPSQAVTQVYLRPTHPFWLDDGHAPSLFTDSECGMVAAVRSGDDPTEITHLTAWVMGRYGAELDALGREGATARVLEAIERIRPAARGRLEPIDMKSWGLDPYAVGAWAYYRPGQVTRLASAAAAPHGRLFFCGEHLARAHRGMEGAMETAETAVAALVGGVH